MFDLRWTELSFGISFLFNLFLFLFIVLYYRKYVVLPKWEKKKADLGLILLALVLIIFTTPLNSDDFFHYQEYVWKYTPGSSNFEPVYDYIIEFVNKNYFLFRLIVWGTAFFFTCKAFRRFEVNMNISIFFLIAVFLMKFNYARATLAMSSYFLGLSFILRPLSKKKVVSFMLALLFFFGSYSFHHSLLPVIAFTIMVAIPVENPIILISSLFILPIVSAFLGEYVYILDMFGEEDLMRKFTIYEAREDGGGQTLIGMFRIFLVYAAFFWPIIIDTIAVISHKKIMDSSILGLFRVMTAILFFAALFLFMDLGNFVFSYRYLFMTFIPLTIITVYLYKNKYIKNWMYYSIVILGITSNVYHYLYGLYKCL